MSMNPVVRAQLKAFERANPSIQMKEPELFEAFTIFAVGNGLLGHNINPFAAHLKGTEFGIDGIAVLIQGELCANPDEVASILEVGKNHSVEFLLFQSKVSEKTDYGELSKFFDAAHNFFTDKEINESDQLRDLGEAKDAVYAAALKRNPSLRLVFASTGTGEASPQITKLKDATIERFRALNIFEEVEVLILGAKDLQNGYRSATNSISAKIEIKKPITLPGHPSVQQAFLGFVAAKDLVELVSLPANDAEPRVNKAVFYDNIRDFDSKSEINIAILEELKKGGRDSFIFKNNGVTVVAREISRKGDVFELEDFQIVNGCQTSNILFLAKGNLQDVNVPFRLIGSSDPEFVSSIIVGTNKQNEVKEDQFWALTPFMKNLEEFCREQPGDLPIFIERRENQYRLEAVERTRICKPSDLVKAIAAMFLFRPHKSARDYRGIRREFADKIFQKSHSVVPYHSAAYAAYCVNYAVRNKRVPSDWGIFKYYVLAAVGLRLTGGADIFGMKKNVGEAACHQINALFSDEDELRDLFTEVATFLNKLIKKAGLADREKVRDFLRSETVANQFQAAFSKK